MIDVPMANVNCTKRSDARSVSVTLENILVRSANQARKQRVLSRAKLEFEKEPPDLDVEVEVNFDISQLCENVQEISLDRNKNPIPYGSTRSWGRRDW